MTAAITRIPADSDLAALLRGLPGDRCPCPHWGYVIAGQFAVRYPDHEETIATGGANHLQPGHAPGYLEGTEVFEVSPTAELNTVIEVMLDNLGPGGWSCPLPGSQ